MSTHNICFYKENQNSYHISIIKYTLQEVLCLCSSNVCPYYVFTSNFEKLKRTVWGEWSGGAKVSCTSRHRGVQLILAYSWARPAIVVAGKGRRGVFLFLLFLHFHSCSSFFPVLSFISSATSSISFLPFSGRRHKMTHKG